MAAQADGVHVATDAQITVVIQVVMGLPDDWPLRAGAQFGYKAPLPDSLRNLIAWAENRLGITTIASVQTHLRRDIFSHWPRFVDVGAYRYATAAAYGLLIRISLSSLPRHSLRRKLDQLMEPLYLSKPELTKKVISDADRQWRRRGVV